MAETRRRILILWLPHLGAEHALRRGCAPPGMPFALVEEGGGVQSIASTEAEARRMGVRPGQGLRDALAVCGALVTRPRDPAAEEAAMAALARWAGRFTPWVAPWGAARAGARTAALALDLTGCAHLWGGEVPLAGAVLEGCTAMGLTARIGIADAPGAAWALARHAPDTGTDAGTGAGIAPRIAGRRSRRTHAGDVAQHIGDASEAARGAPETRSRGGARPPGWEPGPRPDAPANRTALGGARAPDAGAFGLRPRAGRAAVVPHPPRHAAAAARDARLPPAPAEMAQRARRQAPTSGDALRPSDDPRRATVPPVAPPASELEHTPTNVRRSRHAPPRAARPNDAPPCVPVQTVAQSATSPLPAFGPEHAPADVRRPTLAFPQAPHSNGHPRSAAGMSGTPSAGAERGAAPDAPSAGPPPFPNGDAIDQEAPATRARASRRAPIATRPAAAGVAIAPPGRSHEALAPLPVAALRVDEATVSALAKVGLRRIADLTALPRAGLARRFGHPLLRRLDQALGSEPEPISPAAPPPRLAVRLTFPEPIGLEEDVLAALDRLLPALCERLSDRGLAARRVRLEALRSEGDAHRIEVGLARPAADPDRIRPLLAMRLGEIEAGFGVDVLRVEAVGPETAEPGGVADAPDPPRRRAPAGGPTAPPGRGAGKAMGRPSWDGPRGRAEGTPFDVPFHDLVGRIGARFGLEAIWRVHPVESHIPEKGHRAAYVAWSHAHPRWPAPHAARPLLLWSPEPLADASADRFRWRGRTLDAAWVSEPERIAPEWWLDEPEWRSGVRDYRRVATTGGEVLWLFYAHGGRAGPGWFCQGAFA